MTSRRLMASVAFGLVALGGAGVVPQMGGTCAWAQAADSDAVAQTMDRIKKTFDEIAKDLGGLTAAEQKKVDALVLELDKQYKAHPETLPKSRDDFFGKVLPRFRAALGAEGQKKYDAMMKKQIGQTAAVLKSVKLHQIGTETAVYAQEHKGQLPATLDEFAAGQDFIWLGAKKNMREMNASFVLAHIKPELAAEGNSFLLADGSVQSFNAEKSAAILADLKAGRNPAPAMKKATIPQESKTAAPASTPPENNPALASQELLMEASHWSTYALAPDQQRKVDFARTFVNSLSGAIFTSMTRPDLNHKYYRKSLGEALGDYMMTDRGLTEHALLDAASKLPTDWKNKTKWTKDARVDWFNKSISGGIYVYLASEKLDAEHTPRDFVICHTTPKAFSHGSFFIFNEDARTVFLDTATSAKVIAELNAGKNPSPAMQTALEAVVVRARKRRDEIDKAAKKRLDELRKAAPKKSSR